VLIPLKNKDGEIVAHATVDEVDRQFATWTWCRDSSTGYVVRVEKIGGGRQRKFLLHREILGLAHGDRRKGDHKDGNPLNNRRSNLRIGTDALNQQNRQGGFGRSPFRGVYATQSGRWMARVRLAGKQYHLGVFDDEKDAAKVAEDFRREHMEWA
jgi:hypothetical protein